VRDSEVTRMSRWRVPAARPARLAIIATFGVLSLFAAACQSTNTAAHGVQAGKGGNGQPAASGQAAQITITPKSGATHAKTSHGVTVTVANGKLSSVHVAAGNGTASGTLSPDKTAWRTRWPLHTGTHYTVTATAVGTDGKTTTATSSFRTLTPAATFTAQTVLGYHQTYGVGIPITLTFSSPVTHRAAVEKAIEIKSSNPVVGAWYWDGNQSVSFRTRQYWPQHTDVSFMAHFNGLEIAPGVYGTGNLSQSFHIGNSLVAVTSTVTHRTRIYWKNKHYATWPDSSGTPGSPETETANGAYLTIEKANPTLMSGHGYKNVPVYWSVRFTWSGNYYHDAPWSVGSQGSANVSHGCVNLSPADSQWYYEHAVPGDPITIIGSPLAGKWDDGWTPWFLTWKQMLHRSATRMAVQAGPSGSTLVDPATLPAKVSHSIIHNSRAGSYLAGNRPA
jgi:lipoprotein-anchoring transpeptidase ErfK/SrfK